MPTIKPSKQELENAINLTIEDLIDHDLKILFCGINPGLYSGATGLHFARPGNRFWKVLHRSGFTPRQLDPSDEHELLEYGLGITCFVRRTTARADELSKQEFIDGGRILEKKLTFYKPKMLAVLGLGAYRMAFDRPKSGVGLQDEKIGETNIWLLPNPSGLNANYQLDDFVELFLTLKAAVE
ncbi:G/U mismatch-specific DNA glycosylase [soil metagenome]